MKKLTDSEMALLDGGDICMAAAGFLAGFSLGAAGMLVAGVATVATGGAATAVVAVGSAVMALYCARP